MSAVYGSWIARCPECNYQVNGSEDKMWAKCTNPNPSARHPVRRPHFAANRTPEASELYRLLTFKTHAEYFRSTPRQHTQLLTVPQTLERSYIGTLGHRPIQRPYRQGWYTSGRAGPRSPVNAPYSKIAVQNRVKDANERCAEKMNYLEQALNELSKTENNLYQFHLSIHPDQQFYFDGRRADLEKTLIEYAQHIETFFVGDPYADYWRRIMSERYQLEDEEAYLEDIVKAYLNIRAQNVLRWREVADLEDLLRDRWIELRRRMEEYCYQGRKEAAFQYGCVAVENFLKELVQFLDLVNRHITDGGVDGFRWFQDPKSRKALFYSREREETRRNSRRLSKVHSPHFPQSPKLVTPSRDSRIPGTETVSAKHWTEEPKRQSLSLLGPESLATIRSDLPFRQTFGQSSPKAQGGPREKHVSFTDLMATIPQQTPRGDFRMLDNFN